MTEVAERFPRIEEKIGVALKAVEGDASASPVLVAVVREFESKARKAKQAITTGGVHLMDQILGQRAALGMVVMKIGRYEQAHSDIVDCRLPIVDC